MDGFLAPPADPSNAAPFYLDAFFEFSADVKICFPDDDPNRRRAEVTRGREERFRVLREASSRGKPGLPGPDDRSIAEYAEGFRKLAEAQRRERCRFSTGLGITTLLPHANAARQVARVYAWKTTIDLSQGKIDDSIANLGVCLRLARDLKPGGNAICQLVSTAIERACVVEILPGILRTPGLRPEHCDKLLKLLTDHELRSINPYLEAIKADSLSALATLHDFTTQPDAVRKDFGVADDAPLGDLLVALADVPGDRFSTLAINARLKNWKPGDNSRVAEAVFRHAKDQIDQAAVTYPARVQSLKDASDALLPDDPGLRLLILITLSPGDSFLYAISRGTAELRASLCLVALKRGNLTGRERPSDLAVVLKAAGVDWVPVDPFDGKSLRMVILDGEPVVYSIGKDGKDDGGSIELGPDRSPADLVLRLNPSSPR